MSGNTKRNIVVATMAVLVCAAVGLNWKSVSYTHLTLPTIA